ncbi:MAG: hypothetical protein ABIQ31_09750 [Ferruginibacter sp.]
MKYKRKNFKSIEMGFRREKWHKKSLQVDNEFPDEIKCWSNQIRIAPMDRSKRIAHYLKPVSTVKQAVFNLRIVAPA